MKDGKLCDGLADAGCICRNKQCKISSGCGTMGATFFTECSTCNENDCEDEGACRWSNGQCNDAKQPRIINSANESCTTWEDCMKDGKLCDGLADAGCICKNRKCKISCENINKPIVSFTKV